MPQENIIVQALEDLEQYKIRCKYEQGQSEHGDQSVTEWAIIRYLEHEKHDLNWFKLMGTHCFGILLIAALYMHHQAHATTGQQDAGLPCGCSLERETVLILCSSSYKTMDQHFDRLFGDLLGQQAFQRRLPLNIDPQLPVNFNQMYGNLTTLLQRLLYVQFRRGQVVLASLKTMPRENCVSGTTLLHGFCVVTEQPARAPNWTTEFQVVDLAADNCQLLSLSSVKPISI